MGMEAREPERSRHRQMHRWGQGAGEPDHHSACRLVKDLGSEPSAMRSYWMLS